MKNLKLTLSRLGIMLFVAVECFAIAAPGVSALDADQKQIMDSNILHFDIRTNEPCTASGTGLTPVDQIAQLLWVGFDGSATPDTVKTVVTNNNVGGIFFTTDFNTSGLNKAFFDSIQKPGGNKLLIAADDEGGQVATFSKSTPSAAAMSSQTTGQVHDLGLAAGKAMADAGLTADLAPVLDIQTPGTLWTQTQRDWSSNPDVITTLAGAFGRGLKDSGITPVYKHFPGIGAIGANGAKPNNTDTAPTPAQSLASLADDLKPYQNLIGSKTDGAVMLSNGFVSDWGGGTTPVSINPDAVKFLRENLKFTGAITTDALNSLANYGPGAIDLPNAVADALAAGVDMPLFVVPAGSADADVKAIIAAVKAKNIPQATIDAAYNHSLALRGITTAAPATTPAAPTTGSTQCCNNGGAGGSVTGTGQEEIIMNYLLQQGFTIAGAAAAIGNMKVESAATLKPNIQEGGRNWPLGGWGLIQWTGGRRINLINFIEAAPYSLTRLYVEDKGSVLNLSPADNAALMKAELDFLMKELNESYKSTLALGKSATDPKTAAADWERVFEGCSPTNGTTGCSVPLRQQYAQEIFDKFKGAAPAPATAATPVCGGAAAGAPGTAGYGATAEQMANMPAECQNGTAAGSVKFLCVGAKYRNLVPYLEVHPYTGKQFSEKWAAGDHSLTLDCSLFIGTVLFDAYGVDFTTTSGEFTSNTTLFRQIPLSEARPGDFFHAPGHIGIILVPGQSILDTGWTHPTSPIDDLNVHGWNKSADYALRYIGPGSTP